MEKQNNTKNNENKINKINKNMLISEALRIHPDIIEVFLEEGIGCAMCPMAQMETIEQGILGHGGDPDKFVKKLNEFLEKNESVEPKENKK